MFRIPRNKARIAFFCLATVTAICYSLLYMSSPVCDDDLWFLHDMAENGGRDNRIKGLVECLRIHYHTDNARFGNALGVVLLLIPKWISSILSAICFFASYILCIKLSDIRTDDYAGLGFLTALLTFGLVWQDAMFSHMYAFNYTWSIALMLVCIAVFIRKKRANSVLCFLLGIVLGGWHESFSTATIAGFGIFLIFNRNEIRKDRLTMLAGLCIGFAWLLHAPNIRYNSHPFSFQYYDSLVFCWVYFVFLVLFLLCIFRKDLRQGLKNPVVVFAMSSIFLIPIVASTSCARASTPALVLACCSIPILLRLQKGRLAISTPIRLFVSFVLWTFTLVHLVAMAAYSFTLNREMSVITDRLLYDSLTTQRKVIFAPVTYQWQRAPFALMGPDREFYENNGRNIYFSTKFHSPDADKTYNHNPIRIIPEELKNYRKEFGQYIESNRPMRIFNGHLIAEDAAYTDCLDATIGYRFFTDSTKVYATPFIGADGYIYHYILPLRNFAATMSGEPQSIFIL